MYKALDVAECVIRKANAIDDPISNLKLQNILYFIQAEFLITKNKPCFREDIEAWGFGPVVPVVYREYKAYGGTSIPHFKDRPIEPIEKEDIALIDEIVEFCKPYSSVDLTDISMKQDPWRMVYSRYRTKVISNESIKEYFSS